MPVTRKRTMIKRVLAALAISGGLALAAPAAQALAAPVASATVPAVLAAPVVHVTPHVAKAYFSWGAVTGAAAYELRVLPAGGGATTRYDHVMSARSVTVALHPGRYVASVRAGRSFPDVHGHWSLAHYLTVKAPASSSLAARALAWAYLQAGKWYVYGGAGPSTFDCSGLVMAAYGNADGIWLPHNTGMMLRSGKLARTGSPQPGDLAFYGTGHVELYVRAGVTFGAHHSGTRIGFTYYAGSSWRPTAFYRVA
jgi:cell wall-associated NlpC family hydrolase